MEEKKEIKEITEIREIVNKLGEIIKILDNMDISHGGEYRLAAKWGVEGAMGFLKNIIIVNKLNERG